MWGAAVALLFSSMVSSAVHAEPLGEPGAFVSDIAARAIQVLEDESLDTEQRLARIEQLTREAFDLETISKLVLARNWRNFDDTQRTAFQREFERYLSRRYRSGVDKYERERIQVVGERAEPRGDVTVQTRIVGGSADNIQVDYRLRKRGDDWRVIDVIAEGVSLVSNYRAQFKEVLAKGGPDLLIETLRDKNPPPPGEASH
jgi:phospholipid transport system substrate-binding protein